MAQMYCVKRKSLRSVSNVFGVTPVSQRSYGPSPYFVLVRGIANWGMQSQGVYILTPGLLFTGASI